MYDPEREKPLGRMYKAVPYLFVGGFATLLSNAVLWQATADEYTRYEAASALYHMGLEPLPNGFRYESPVLLGMGACSLDEYVVVRVDVWGPDGQPRHADVCFEFDGDTRVVLGETNPGGF